MSTPLYLLASTDASSANPIHILTNGKANIGSNSPNIIVQELQH